jgi:hypothetical protein
MLSLFHFSIKRICFVSLVFILFMQLTIPVKAQSKNTINNQLWGDFFITHTFNEHFRINPLLSYRRLAGDTGWKQYIFNPDFIFTWNDFVHIHGGVFFQYTDDHNRRLFEIRPWEGAMIFFPRIKGFFIQHYLRLEERFIYSIDEDGSAYSTRLRYYLQAFIPINHLNIIDHTFYIWPGIEFFMELSGTNIDRIVDRTRFNLGVGYRFSKFYRFEFCYMQQGTRTDNNSGFTTTDRMFRFVNRITIF